MGGINPLRKRNALVVRTAPSNRARGFVSIGPLTVPAAIGRSGTTSRKREGDGATPIATMRALSGFVRGDRLRALPPTALPLTRIASHMLWCDDPGHACYNRPVRAPFAPSHEVLARADGLYDICLVLDWNVTERRRHRGSAIFLHLIRPGYEPTAGCIAVSLRDMRRILPLLRRGSVVKVMG